MYLTMLRNGFNITVCEDRSNLGPFLKRYEMSHIIINSFMLLKNASIYSYNEGEGVPDS